jgi:hypothetical protein
MNDDTILTTRRVIPVGMVLATMVASVLVALQSSSVPALLAGTHDELKLSTDDSSCAVTGPFNHSAAFEDDLVGCMPRRTCALHVKMTRDLGTTYDIMGRCPLPGPCTKNSAWYTEWLGTSPTPRQQASPDYLTGFVGLSWTTVLIGLLAYVGCYVRLEARIQTQLNPSPLRIGSSEPSLIRPWQRKAYDRAALESGLWGVTAYVLWTLGFVILAALQEFPMNLNTMSVTLFVLVPLIGGWAVVTVMGQLSFGCLVMYISALIMIGHDHLGLAGKTPWWAVWGMVSVTLLVVRRCISASWLSGDVAFVLLGQVGCGMLWLNTLAAAAAVPSFLGQLPTVVLSVDWTHLASLVLSWTAVSMRWAAAVPFFGQLPGIVLSVMASDELRTCASLTHSWTAASLQWAAVWFPWVTVLTPWVMGLVLWAVRLGTTTAFSSWAFDVASWEYGVACQNLVRPKALFLESFTEHLDNNYLRVTGTEAPPSRRSRWLKALGQSGLAARWETFKRSTFRIPSTLGRPAEIAWGIGVVAESWGVPLSWLNLGLVLATTVLFSLALPLTGKRCMLLFISILAPVGHILGLCAVGVFSFCMVLDSTSDTDAESWSHSLSKEVQKDLDWISCYMGESQKVLEATERCCALADERFRALVKGRNLEVLVLGRDFKSCWKDTASKTRRTRRRRRPQPPPVVPDPQPECDRALCSSPLGVLVLPSKELQPLPNLPPPGVSGTGRTGPADSTTSEGTRTPSEDFTLWAQGAMSTLGTTAGAAMCCGQTKVDDIKTLVETHLTGEGRVAKLSSLEAALRDHRRLYTQDQYRKYGAAVTGSVRERAGRNAKCVADRLELHCTLFAENPVWSLIAPSGEAPAPPEVLSDAMVLTAASRAKLTLKIAEDRLSEAEELGIRTESVEVEDEWEDWPEEKQKFVAEVGRMNIIDAQVEFLRRLREAARLQEPGSDLRSATAEQVKGWRNILAPERVDLTGDEGEGGSGPNSRLAGGGAGDDGLASLTSRTARATISSGPETSTAADFRAFVEATTRLQQEIASAVNLSSSRTSPRAPGTASLQACGRRSHNISL